MAQSYKPKDILDFWYASDISVQWFNSTEKLDKHILSTYGVTWKHARDSKLDHWCETAEGCLALCIVLDQFPLNMFRGQPESFATEARAIATSYLAIEKGFDQELPKDRLAFLYMPLMHSENLQDQKLSVKLFEESGLKNNARFARHHYGIVERFGRFPHRNEILQRESTPEELEWLASDEAFTG